MDRKKLIEKLEKELGDEIEEVVSPSEIELKVLVKKKEDRVFFKDMEVQNFTSKARLKELSMQEIPICVGLSSQHLAASFDEADFILIVKIGIIEGIVSGKLNTESFMHIDVFCASSRYSLLGLYMMNILKSIVYREYTNAPLPIHFKINYFVITLDSIDSKNTIDFYERNGFRHPENFQKNSTDSVDDEEYFMTYIWRATYDSDFSLPTIKRYIGSKHSKRALKILRGISDSTLPRSTTPKRYKNGMGTKKRRKLKKFPS